MSDKRKHTCVICGKLKGKKDIDILSVTQQGGGLRYLGYVCNGCVEHIKKLKYFEPIIDEGEDNEDYYG